VPEPFELDNYSIIPCYSSSADTSELAKDHNNFHLTAIGECKHSVSFDELYDLSGLLTYCQQQWVEISQLIEEKDNANSNNIICELPKRLQFSYTRYHLGDLVQSLRSKIELIDRCLVKLKDKNFEENTGYRKSLFRHVQTFKLIEPLMDVIYYLDFSALEIHVRIRRNDFDTNIAEVATHVLRDCYNLDVYQFDKNHRTASLQVYADLRNALLHNGQYERTKREDDEHFTYKLTDYCMFFRRLIPDVLLKAISFDDGTINWNRWLDRQPFI
jgi:hypothetical protein